jgi:hypothetical protein
MTALVAAVLSTGAVDLLAAEPSYEELLRENQALKARLDEAQAEAAAAAAAQPTYDARDVDRVVRDVVRDADAQSQLLAQSPVSAGWDNGFFIKSDDGAFLLKPAVQAQFRSVTNFREEAKNGDGDSVQNGFEFRRLRFRFDGTAFTPNLAYSFVWDTNRAGGAVTLLDAWVKYKFADDWSFRVGQFKDPVHHERLLSGFNQLAVERTLVESLIGGNLTDRVQGVSLIYGDYAKNNPIYAELAFHDGVNSRNTDFRDTVANPTAGQPPTFNANYGFGARLEYKAFGDWANYRDYTAKGVKTDLLVLGAGIDYTQRDGSDQYLPTADVQWKSPTGWAAYAALYVRQIEFRGGTGDDSRFDWGAQGQLSYLLNKQWELFGRYDITVFDEDFVATGAEDTFHEITAGLNYYLGKEGAAGHKAKVTLDVVYLPNGSPSDQTGLGVLAGTEDQFLIRGQFTFQL